jgi:dTMP kinase
LIKFVHIVYDIIEVMNPISNPDMNPMGVKTLHGKTFPEYVNPSNIPLTYVSLDNPHMRQAYANAKKLHAIEGLTDKVRRMTITSSVIVKDEKILGQGANGNGWHQENNTCVRIEKNLPTGVGYDQCPGCHSDNHAERVAIREAGEKAHGADLYLYGHWWVCAPCWNAITEAGIAHIYLLEDADMLFDRNESTTVIGTPKQYAGKIIVIEGSDGTGKETQAKLLTENLEKFGYTVGHISYPQYDSEQSVGGRLLKYVLKSADSDKFMYSKLDPYAASMLYAMDRRESKPLIETYLQKYDFVIMDRYYTANLLHQGAKLNEEESRNKYLKTMHTIEVTHLEIPESDIVIYLTLPPEVAIKRVEKRKEETGEGINQTERDHEYIQRSIERGLSIAQYLGWNVIEGVEFASDGKTVTKEYSKEERQEQVLKVLKDKNII